MVKSIRRLQLQLRSHGKSKIACWLSVMSHLEDRKLEPQLAIYLLSVRSLWNYNLKIVQFK